MRYFFIISLLLPALAVSSDPNKCSSIKDDLDRLACYDSIFNKNQSLKVEKDTVKDPLILSVQKKRKN